MTPKIEHFQLGDTITILDRSAIVNADAVNNGEQFIVVGVHADTAESYAHIIIIDNEGEELPINESEFGAIRYDG